jgi:hypothetical protein
VGRKTGRASQRAGEDAGGEDAGGEDAGGEDAEGEEGGLEKGRRGGKESDENRKNKNKK